MTYSELLSKTRIIRSKRCTVCIQIKDGEIQIRVPFLMSDKDAYAFFDEHFGWVEKHYKSNATPKAVEKLTKTEIENLKKAAREYIPQRVDYYAEKLGVSYGKITVRCQKTLWGSCTSKRNLSFNCLLMLTSKEVVDSVVCHELCHIFEMNHSSRFYERLLRLYPNYYECRKWLKSNGKYIFDKV